MEKLAVVLLSGGLDSTTVAAKLKYQGYELLALSFNYGQRHRAELDAAVQVAAALGVREHHIIPLPEILFGGALTGQGEVTLDRPLIEMAHGVPSTFVPGRNVIFIALAAALAAKRGAELVGLGVNALDYSGYPDCRPDFINVQQAALDLALDPDGLRKVFLYAPLLRLTKAEIVQAGLAAGAPLHLTHSCYAPIEEGGVVKACGRCDSCQLRKRGFEEAGVPDPTLYAQR